MNSSLTAYGQLTPDTVLEALDAVGLRGDGRILQLNSYENRVFRLMLEDGGAEAGGSVGGEGVLGEEIGAGGGFVEGG